MAASQMEMAWANFDGTPTIYLTDDDPGLNQVSLTFVNQLAGPVTLPPVTLSPPAPAPWQSIPPQPGLYVFFEGLIDNAQVQAIEVVALSTTAWTPASFVDANTGFAYLALAPSAAVTLAVGEGVEFVLTGILASTASDSGSVVYASFANAEGISTLPLLSTPVSVVAQPTAGNQELDLLVGFTGGNVVFTGQANSLYLYLTNPNPTPLVPSGTWGPVPPTFQLSFVFGTSAGALTTPAQAPFIDVNVFADYGNVWSPTEQQQGELPVWDLQPGADGGGTVLGTGAGATIQFAITNIVILAEAPPGVTYAYLAYFDVPGYDDGFFALEIVVADPVSIESFTATPNPVTGATAGTQVQLAWTVQDADYVTITNTNLATSTAASGYVPNCTVTVYATTTYTLIATSSSTGQQVSMPLTVTVEPDIFDLVPTNAIVLYNGTTAPPGWVLCDGTNDTPDLGTFTVTNGTPPPPSYTLSFIMKNT